MAAKNAGPVGNLPDPKLGEKLDELMPLDAPEGMGTAGYDRGYRSGFEDGEREALSPAPTLIFGKMIEIARMVGAVGKNSVNVQQGYNFRGIDAVVNALHPAMAEVGVFALPELVQVGYRDAMTTTNKPTREVTVQVRYTFYAEDGSSVAAVVPGESLDQSDKGSAKAMSVAFRIALLQAFSLPTSESDPDASYHTRDGVGAMGEATRTYLLANVTEVGIPELDQMWAIVLEHSAAERTIGTAEITWADYFAQRLAEIVAEIRDAEEGRTTYEEIKDSPLRILGFQDKTIALLMRERAQAIKQQQAEAFDRHVTAITNSVALEELELANMALQASRKGQAITPEQFAELTELVSDRRAKLERELNVAVNPSGSES